MYSCFSFVDGRSYAVGQGMLPDIVLARVRRQTPAVVSPSVREGGRPAEGGPTGQTEAPGADFSPRLLRRLKSPGEARYALRARAGRTRLDHQSGDRGPRSVSLCVTFLLLGLPIFPSERL